MSQETTSGHRVAFARSAEDESAAEQTALTTAQCDFAAVIGQALAQLWLKGGASSQVQDSEIV